MKSLQRQRANAMLQLLVRKLDVFPMPIVVDMEDIGCFEMTWNFEEAYLNIACFADRHNEFFIEYHDSRPTWENSTMSLAVPVDFLAAFTALCRRHLEKAA